MGVNSDRQRARGDADDMGAAPETPSRALVLSDAATLARWLRAQLARTVPATPITPDPPTARIAAVLPLLYPRNGVPCLLFTRRSPALTRHRGEISFPGGSRDPGDASLAATELRETWEELHLDDSLIEPLGALPPLFTVVSNFWVTPIVGWLPDGLPPLEPNPAEVDEVIEAPVAALADPAIFHEETWVRNGVGRAVHFYDYGSYRIWGLTGYILSTLLALLPAE